MVIVAALKITMQRSSSVETSQCAPIRARFRRYRDSSQIQFTSHVFP
jgi:hypothetical protein